MNTNNNLFDLALNQAGVFAITDIEGRYVYANAAWEAQTGINADFAIGKYTYDLIEGSSAMLAMRTRHPIIGEVFLTTKTGKEINAVISYHPVVSAGNKEVIGCAISESFSDIDVAAEFNERFTSVLDEFNYRSTDDRPKNGAKYAVENIIGNCDAMKKLKDQIYMAASSSANVLIEGETGTGKELVAHSVHNASMRRIFPFIRVNCSAIPENLMESEFFGYEEGSFTGSKKGGHKGKFEKAHLGSIFLDEINAMNLTMQPKLLRVLQEKEIERIGASESISIDTRVIAASNKPLKNLIKQGKFRSDLFYRLNIITIQIPPLRERKEDIPDLIDFNISKLNEEMSRNVKSVSGPAMDMLLNYDWPGNVRELQNVIERAMNSTWGDELKAEHFNILEYIREDYEETETSAFKKSDNAGVNKETGRPEAIDMSKKTGSHDTVGMTLGEQKAAGERAAVLTALESCGGNKSKAAKVLGISRTMLYKKLEKYGIE